MNDVPIVQWKSALKGFLAGSLISGGIANPYGIGIQAGLFVIGLLVLLDTLLPSGKEMYGVTTAMTSIAGFIIALLLSWMGYSLYYLALVVIVTVLVYINRIMDLSKKRSKE